MTITITAENQTATDFFAYLDLFDQNFQPSGRGVFSHGISGDYAVAETAITETADLNSQAFIIGDGTVYSFDTHTVSGTINKIQFGFGATAMETAPQSPVELNLAQLDFTIGFEPDLDDPDNVNDIIYGLLGYLDPGEGATDALVDLLQTQDIAFFGKGSDDVFTAFNGDDMLKGNGGNDTLGGKGGDDTIKGGKGDDTISGGKGNDDLKGNKGADVITGGKGDDVISGGNGKDDLKGSSGADVIQGGGSADTISGGKNADVISGDGGNDQLSGGGGKDTFVFAGDFGTDTISDFQTGKDLLDFSGLTGEAQTFKDFAAATEEHASGLIYDLGGDGNNVIVLQNISLDDLGASDFLF